MRTQLKAQEGIEIVDLVKSTKRLYLWDDPKYRKAKNLAVGYLCKYGGRSLFNLFLNNYQDMPSDAHIAGLIGLCMPIDREIRHDTKPGYYPYIGFDRVRFLHIARFLKNNFMGDSFVDIGSGPGDKVVLAKVAGFTKVRGIEVEKSTSDLGNFLLKPKIKIENSDVFDVTSLKDDIIYMYHPIADNKLYLKMIAHILKIMKNDSRIIEVLTSTIRYVLREKYPKCDYFDSIVAQKYYENTIEFFGLRLDGSELRTYSPIGRMEISEFEAITKKMIKENKI